MSFVEEKVKVVDNNERWIRIGVFSTIVEGGWMKRDGFGLLMLSEAQIEEFPNRIQTQSAVCYTLDQRRRRNRMIMMTII